VALYPNGRYMTQNPGRHFGPAPGLDNYARDRGDRLNVFVNAYWDKVTGAVPSGYGMAGAVPPLRSGGLASVLAKHVSVDGQAIGILGLPAIGSATLEITVQDMAGQLVVSGSGQAIFEILTGLSNLSAALYGIGAADLDVTTNTPQLQAKGWLVGNGQAAMVAALVPYGVGHMIGSALPYTELSPQSLAAAVWGAVAAEFDAAGTMGEKLNGAGSAGNPWTEVIEAGLTAAEIQRIILAALAGRSTQVGDVVTFRDQANTKDRITGTVDADGNRLEVAVDGE
jgi:hypothetical protein